MKLHPAVADCLVVGVPDDRFGEAVTAVVALRAGRRADARPTSPRALESLARFKRPRRFVFVARDRARPERQGRLQVGQGPGRAPPSSGAAAERETGGPEAARSSTQLAVGYFFLPLCADLGEHVTRAEDQEVLAVDGDLGAAVLRVDDGVADARGRSG